MIKMEPEIEHVVEILEDLQNNGSVPKNVKEKMATSIHALKEETETSIKVNRAMHELEEIADDPNLESYTRTQIWNVVSALEKIA